MAELSGAVIVIAVFAIPFIAWLLCGIFAATLLNARLDRQDEPEEHTQEGANHD